MTHRGGLSGLAAVATDVGGLSEIARRRQTVGARARVPTDALAARLVAAIPAALARHDALGLAARERCLARFEIEPVAARWRTLLGSLAGA